MFFSWLHTSESKASLPTNTSIVFITFFFGNLSDPDPGSKTHHRLVHDIHLEIYLFFFNNHIVQILCFNNGTDWRLEKQQTANFSAFLRETCDWII